MACMHPRRHTDGADERHLLEKESDVVLSEAKIEGYRLCETGRQQPGRAWPDDRTPVCVEMQDHWPLSIHETPSRVKCVAVFVMQLRSSRCSALSLGGRLSTGPPRLMWTTGLGKETVRQPTLEKIGQRCTAACQGNQFAVMLGCLPCGSLHGEESLLTTLP